MKILLQISLILSFFTANCQIEKELANALRGFDFAKIDIIKQNSLKDDSTLNIVHQNFSDIVKDYQGGYIILCYGSFEEHGVLAWVKCIKQNGKIVYYDLRDERNSYFYYSSNLSKYLAPIKLYSFNKTLYDNLLTDFKADYDTDFDLKEFFKIGITYGDECGIGGTKLPEMKTIDSLVERNDKDSLSKWLHSSNTVKQIYGLCGLYKLKQKGIKVDKAEELLIKKIMDKKGIIQTCSGCTFEDMTIKEICKDFKF